jgi:hypothetical protein
MVIGARALLLVDVSDYQDSVLARVWEQQATVSVGPYLEQPIRILQHLEPIVLFRSVVNRSPKAGD